MDYCLFIVVVLDTNFTVQNSCLNFQHKSSIPFMRISINKIRTPFKVNQINTHRFNTEESKEKNNWKSSFEHLNRKSNTKKRTSNIHRKIKSHRLSFDCHILTKSQIDLIFRHTHTQSEIDQFSVDIYFCLLCIFAVCEAKKKKSWCVSCFCCQILHRIFNRIDDLWNNRCEFIYILDSERSRFLIETKSTKKNSRV